MSETIGERVAMEWHESTPAEQQKLWLCDRIDAAVREAVAAEREACAEIALAIDSGRGNEKEIAAAIQNRK